jgi:hypothetical protein
VLVCAKTQCQQCVNSSAVERTECFNKESRGKTGVMNEVVLRPKENSKRASGIK